MKQALVLGAAGFIGRYCVKALSEAGYQVHGIGHGSWDPKEQREWGLHSWHHADVTLASLQTYGGQPEVLIQAAGSGSVAFSMTHPAQDYARSVETTLIALEFMRVQAPLCRMVLPSSAAVYGNTRNLPIRTIEPLAPASPYGEHKKIAEDLCRSYSTHFGLRTAIVRLFSVYGIGLRKQLLWDACLKLREGDAEFFGTGNERRDMLHVHDAARLILAAADRATAQCPVVNGGTGEMTSVGELVSLIADAMGTSASYRFKGENRGGDPIDFQACIEEATAWGWYPERKLATEVETIVDWIAAEVP